MDFPGGPVVRTLHFQCRGHIFNPWLGDLPISCCVAKKKKKKKKSISVTKSVMIVTEITESVN